MYFWVCTWSSSITLLHQPQRYLLLPLLCHSFFFDHSYFHSFLPFHRVFSPPFLLRIFICLIQVLKMKVTITGRWNKYLESPVNIHQVWGAWNHICQTNGQSTFGHMLWSYQLTILCVCELKGLYHQNLKLYLLPVVVWQLSEGCVCGFPENKTCGRIPLTD